MEMPFKRKRVVYEGRKNAITHLFVNENRTQVFHTLHFLFERERVENIGMQSIGEREQALIYREKNCIELVWIEKKKHTTLEGNKTSVCQ